MSKHTTKTIARAVKGELLGAADVPITGVHQIDAANQGQITFIGEQKFAERWPKSRASAALVARQVTLEADDRPVIVVDDADLAMAVVLELFAPEPIWPEVGVHRSAVVDASANIDPSARIGPQCLIGPGVHIEARTVLHGQVTVLAQCAIGEDCVIWPGAVVRERCTIGHRCILHPNVTIGADGFGYRPATGATGPYLQKIPQIGTVMIEDDVEIGAGSCVDRGKFAETRIGAGTKIDNLVQIGHNCQLGRMVVLAGCVGVAGSVTIGDGTMIGGGAGLRDHITLGKRVQITAGALVADDVPDGQAWGGTPARPVRQAMREAMALRKLPDLVKQFKRR